MEDARVVKPYAGSAGTTSIAVPTRARRRLGWLYPAIIMFLLGAIGWAWLNRENERGLSTILTMAASSLIVLSTVVWAMFQQRWPAALRFGPLMLMIASLVVFIVCFKIVGFTGAMRPVVVSRFYEREEPAPPSDGDIKQSTGTSAATFVPVDPITPETDYPNFMGPNRDQIISSVALARDWTALPPKLMWKQPIGLGWSGFAVVGDNAITQEQREESEMVVCYELKTGQIRWTHSNPVRFQQAPGGIGPRATPTIFRGRVFTQGATGILDCLNLATGELLWSKNVVEENNAKNLFWGKANSPVILDELVLISVGGTEGRSLVAYRQDSGAIAWHGGDDFASYSSPQIGTVAGVKQVLLVVQDFVVGHDATNGKVLWRTPLDGKSDSNASNSQARVVGDDLVFISKGYGIGSALLKLTGPQLSEAATSGVPAAPGVVWRKNVMKTKMNNISIRDGFVYGLDEEILQCIELKTGKSRWKHRRFGQGQILMVGDLLLVQSEQGEISMIEASPDGYNELGKFQAIEGEPCWNPMALSGPYLLVRNSTEAACYALPLK